MNNMCFEVLGMDIILNHKLKPYLLEVNHTPSFTTDTPLDKHIKRNLINDTLKLMNVSVKTRNEIINERKDIMQVAIKTNINFYFFLIKIAKSSNGKEDKINNGRKERTSK